MKMMWPLLLAFAAILTCSSVGYSAIYKWVDENGVVTFKDTPPPAGLPGQVVNPAPAVRGGAPSNTAIGSAPAKAKASRKPLPRVEIYTTSWCPSCKAAKRFLDANKVPFVEYDVEKDKRAAERFRKKHRGSGVPLALIGDSRIVGFSASRYRQALGLR